MDVALCYESVLPARGGCETYVASIARRLVREGHTVHLYARRWDEAALPPGMNYHRLVLPRVPHFLRPWVFSAACAKALHNEHHDVSIGFDKIWGADVLYPQGGLYVASSDHNLLKHRSEWKRSLTRWMKRFDPTFWSFRWLEQKQYSPRHRPLIIAISEMVRGHFTKYYGIRPEDLRVVHIATDPARFLESDRPRQRAEWRSRWQIGAEENVALFVGMNYRLKGLEPLLRSVRLLPSSVPFRLLVVGSNDTRAYESLARQIGVADRVRFLGYCPDVRNAYFASDFLVHPTFYDPCSHVVPEAMACGLPVISTQYNGATELMRVPQTGYVIDDPHDHKHLAWCMTQMFDAERRKECAHAGREVASRWTYEDHYDKLMNVLSEAVERKRAAA